MREECYEKRLVICLMKYAILVVGFTAYTMHVRYQHSRMNVKKVANWW